MNGYMDDFCVCDVVFRLCCVFLFGRGRSLLNFWISFITLWGLTSPNTGWVRATVTDERCSTDAFSVSLTSLCCDWMKISYLLFIATEIIKPLHHFYWSRTLIYKDIQTLYELFVEHKTTCVHFNAQMQIQFDKVDENIKDCAWVEELFFLV